MKFNVAVVVARADALVSERTGMVPSTTIALAPAILFAPVGKVVATIAFPARSTTVPAVNDDAVRSDETSPA